MSALLLVMALSPLLGDECVVFFFHEVDARFARIGGPAPDPPGIDYLARIGGPAPDPPGVDWVQLC